MLLSKEEILTEVFSALLNNYLVLDSDGTIQFANKDWLTYKSDELQNQNFSNYLIKPHKIKFLEYLKQNKNSNPTSEISSFRIQNTKNSDIWESEVIPLTKDQKIVGFLVKLKNMKDFGTSNESISKILETSQEAFILLNTEGRVINHNKVALQFLNSQENDLFGASILDLIGSENVAIYKNQEHLRSLLKSCQYEINIPTSTGTVNCFSITESQILGSQGMRIGSYLVINNITSHKDLINTAQKTNEFLEKIINNISSAIFTLDLSGRFLKVSHQMTIITGFLEEELLNQPFSILFSDENKFYVTSFLEETIDHNKKIEQYKIEILGKNKRKKFLSLAAQPLSENNVITSILCSADDITDLVQAESFLQKEREKSEFSNRMAMIGTMAGGIAHEINNPVTVITVLAMNIKNALTGEKKELEKAISFSDQIQSTCNRIVKIVQGLKTFARQDGGLEKPQPKKIAELFDDTLILCQERISKEGVQLKMSANEDLMYLCRPVQMSQVLINLISNAIDAVKGKHVKPENKWVNVTAKQDEKFLEIAVEDGGPGVPDSLRSKIMDPFFTTKDPAEGTGLGLSISFEIIKTYGGELFLDEKHPPTRFVIRLPLK